MKKKLIIIILAIAMVIGVVAWLLVKDNNKPIEPAPAPAPAEETLVLQTGEIAVSISDFKFQPQKLLLKKGSIVTWTNQDEDSHDIVSDSDSEKRGLLSPLMGLGDTYQFEFTEVGTYTYHCRPHPYMTGSIQVVE